MKLVCQQFLFSTFFGLRLQQKAIKQKIVILLSGINSKQCITDDSMKMITCVPTWQVSVRKTGNSPARFFNWSLVMQRLLWFKDFISVPFFLENSHVLWIGTDCFRFYFWTSVRRRRLDPDNFSGDELFISSVGALTTGGGILIRIPRRYLINNGNELAWDIYDHFVRTTWSSAFGQPGHRFHFGGGKKVVRPLHAKTFRSRCCCAP